MTEAAHARGTSAAGRFAAYDETRRSAWVGWVIFAFHGYPWLIHRLTYRRTNHANFHVRGYKEEGTTTTPFDMTVLNQLDRFHLAGHVLDRVERLRNVTGHFKQFLRDKLIEHRDYVNRHGEDMPEVRDWKWAR